MKRELSEICFIDKAKELYGDIDDFSNIKFINMNKPANFMCRRHGEFKQSPASYLIKRRCLECKIETNLSSFLLIAEQKHGAKYDYSMISLDNINNERLPILCKKAWFIFTII